LSTIKWYVDDALIQTVVRTSNSVLDDNWPFDKEFHIILNTAVGGTLGGTPNLNGELHHMQVDYVRVYQKINN
jgi:beta-glucanase (GH16 family)